jgi:pimeloyl-ACP methyl ester carboxylesterase
LLKLRPAKYSVGEKNSLRYSAFRPGAKWVSFMSDFDEQWSRPFRLAADPDHVAIYDLKPAHEKSERPVLLVPGWGGTPEMYRSNIAMLFEAGRRILIVDAPHGIENALPEASMNEMPKAQERRIAALILTLDDRQIQQTDAIGHSEGCLDLVFSAYLFSARFNSLVLVESPGLFGEDAWWRLAGRFLIDALGSYRDLVGKPELKRPLLLATREIGSSFVRDPVQSGREVFSIANAQIKRLLRLIKRNEICVSMIHGVDDRTFPMNRVQELITSDMVDGFFSVKGRHGQFQLEPSRYTKLADYALTAMDAKRKSANLRAIGS